MKREMLRLVCCESASYSYDISWLFQLLIGAGGEMYRQVLISHDVTLSILFHDACVLAAQKCVQAHGQLSYRLLEHVCLSGVVSRTNWGPIYKISYTIYRIN